MSGPVGDPSPRAQQLIEVLRAHPEPANMKLHALCGAADLLMPGSAVILTAHAQQGKDRVSVDTMLQPLNPPRRREEPLSRTDVLDLFAVLAGAGFATLEADGTVLVMSGEMRSMLSR